MNKRMKKDELLKLIESLKIDKNEFWILSSGALVLRGIYDDAGDLDIAVTNKGLEELKKNYNLIRKENGWYIVNDEVECVCDGDKDKLKYKPEYNGEYYLQNINEYYEYLKQSARDKDKVRIPIVENYMKKKIDFK